MLVERLCVNTIVQSVQTHYTQVEMLTRYLEPPYQHTQVGTQVPHISIQVWSYLAVFFSFVSFQKSAVPFPTLVPGVLSKAASSQVCQLCPVCALALFTAVRLGHRETKELQQDGSPLSTMAKRSPVARFSSPATTLSLR